MSLFRALIVATLLGTSVATALPVLAASAPSRSTQEQVLFDLLEAPHPQVDGKTLQRLGPDVPSILIRYATTKTTKKTMQLRALAWLQHVPSTQTLAVLREVLYARDSDRTTLRTALRALGGGFGLAAWDDLRRHLTPSRRSGAGSGGVVDARRGHAGPARAHSGAVGRPFGERAGGLCPRRHPGGLAAAARKVDLWHPAAWPLANLLYM